MSRFDDCVRIVRTVRTRGSVGDIGLLKAEVFGAGTPRAVEQRIENAGLQGPMRIPCLDELRALPAGSLGREYARVLEKNGYQPFSISEDLVDRSRAHTGLLRYIATHDFIHVVTGFDTGRAGEIGVLATTVEQGFAPAGALQEAVARAFYWLRDFSNREAIAHNRALGHRMGAAAKDLLTFRYEDNLERPVVAVRRQLALPDPAEAGIRFPLQVEPSPIHP